MFIDQQIPEACKDLWQECHELIPGLLTGAPVKATSITIPTNSQLEADDDNIYLIRDGVLSEYYQDRMVMNYEEGDLAGADRIWHPKAGIFRADFAIVVDTYDKQAFREHLLSDPESMQIWNQYISCLSQSFHILMSHFNRQETSFHPELREYNEGDIIIHEGASDTEVFTLLSGSAEARIGDTVVGEINTDEIFGAIAALTATRRTASIIAKTDCTALVVQSDRFKNLITVRPDTVTKLVEDMARTIISCNAKIVDLS